MDFSRPIDVQSAVLCRDLVETHSLTAAIYNWRCGKAIRFQGSRVVVDFDAGLGEKAIKPENLRRAVLVPLPEASIDTAAPLLQHRSGANRSNFRCASRHCNFRVHDNQVFGSYCCRRCQDSIGTIHGRYCQRKRAGFDDWFATEAQLLLYGGGLTMLWRTIASLSRCNSNGGFKSLNDSMFRSFIFMHFVPRCHLKPKSWIFNTRGLVSVPAYTYVGDEHVATHTPRIIDAINPTDHAVEEVPYMHVQLITTDDVQHVAEIPAAEASNVANQQWASAVERGIQSGWHLQTDEIVAGQACVSDDRLLILTFGRHPKEFERALLESSLAQELSHEGVLVKPDWAGGAKILARGVTDDLLAIVPFALGVEHVIVAVSDEKCVYEALQELPYAKRPRLKRSCGRLPLDDDMELFNVSDDESAGSNDALAMDVAHSYMPIRRTFIHFSSESTSSARTVSTSQMRHPPTRNPRSRVTRNPPSRAAE
eukprot:TRINITY_DN27448_c0_g1_i1.p1 TRINITY_DN27448_c0_g1~~TRINITY_DN27448_c0_g1_i1.p1  ORF type:complete len:481 (+),score=32.41 TRINITY_DN27448_c0_g1_i1:57-1499(+)